MIDALTQLSLFTAKVIILMLAVSFLLILFFALIAKGKEKFRARMVIKNLNKKYEELAQELLQEISPKKVYKKYLKEQKSADKAKQKSAKNPNNVFVLNFHGDIKASAVNNLREEVTAILKVATKDDEVVVRLESPGGIVPSYGLATSQLERIRAQHIPLTVTVDKIAASGGYLMACVANKIYAAPFAIIGSIGVIAQLPNFNRYLKEKNIDFEQHTAGEYKRTISLFGEITNEGREKLHEELEAIHNLFTNLISEYRPQVDMKKVATGEHWPAKDAFNLQLVDALKTSDEYLLNRSKDAHVYEVCYEIKKPLFSKLTASAKMLRENVFPFYSDLK